jgi:hypothetical protein
MIVAVSARILLAGLCLRSLATSAYAECARALRVMQGTMVDHLYASDAGACEPGRPRPGSARR